MELSLIISNYDSMTSQQLQEEQSHKVDHGEAVNMGCL